MKKFVVIVMMLMVSILSACGSDTVKVGIDAQYAPFEYMDGGKIVGFDVDLLEAVMKEAGIEYKLENTGWDPLFAAIDSKQLEMGISSITINDKRKQKYDFSSPYFESRNMIMVKKDSPVKSADDLKSLDKIGVQNGTTGQSVVEAILGAENSKISKYESNVLAIMALKNGEVDAVVCDNTVAEEFVKNNPGDNLVAIDDTVNFEAEYYGIIFVKGSEYKEKVDKALQTVLENGTYTEIYKKWFKTEPNLDNLK